MVKISKEWYNKRLDVLEDFWNNKIDFKTFKSKIKKVDKQFKKKQINNLKKVDKQFKKVK